MRIALAENVAYLADTVWRQRTHTAYDTQPTRTINHKPQSVAVEEKKQIRFCRQLKFSLIASVHNNHRRLYEN